MKHETNTTDNIDREESLARIARLIGFGGLVPFVGLTVALFVAPADWLMMIKHTLSVYAAIILSFLGGIAWGISVTGSGPHTITLCYSMVPPVMAWIAVLLPVDMGTILLCFGFAMAYMHDRTLWQTGGMESWFIRLRFRLTIGVLVTLAISLWQGSGMI